MSTSPRCETGGAPRARELCLAPPPPAPPGAAMAAAAAHRGSLMSLSLRGSAVGDAGATAIARALIDGGGDAAAPPTSVGGALRVLDLTASGVHDAGACALARALRARPEGALETLGLSANRIGRVAAAALVRALDGKPTRVDSGDVDGGGTLAVAITAAAPTDVNRTLVACGLAEVRTRSEPKGPPFFPFLFRFSFCVFAVGFGRSVVLEDCAHRRRAESAIPEIASPRRRAFAIGVRAAAAWLHGVVRRRSIRATCSSSTGSARATAAAPCDCSRRSSI